MREEEGLLGQFIINGLDVTAQYQKSVFWVCQVNVGNSTKIIINFIETFNKFCYNWQHFIYVAFAVNTRLSELSVLVTNIYLSFPSGQDPLIFLNFL